MLCRFLNLGINEDGLFDELCLIEKAVRELKEKKLSTLQLWMYILKKGTMLTEVTKLVTKAFSVPTSQAPIERIFSSMNLYWSGTRNLCSLNLIKAELAIKINFKLNCSEFLADLKKTNQDYHSTD